MRCYCFLRNVVDTLAGDDMTAYRERVNQVLEDQSSHSGLKSFTGLSLTRTRTDFTSSTKKSCQGFYRLGTMGRKPTEPDEAAISCSLIGKTQRTLKALGTSTVRLKPIESLLSKGITPLGFLQQKETPDILVLDS